MVLGPVCALSALFVFSACAIGSDDLDTEVSASEQQGWDSQHANPTHATHSYLTELAIDQVAPRYPEIYAYQTTLVEGANTELHELPLKNPDLEALRRRYDGTNAACNHPELVWADANQAYFSGATQRAYFLLGVLLHYVEDLGVPAHALGVEHQGTWSDMDNFEWMALTRWAPDFATSESDPFIDAPDAYVAWSAQWTRDDFASAFPGQTYRRNFFPLTWVLVSKRYTSFVKQREGRSAIAASYALEAAMRNWWN